MRTLVIAFEYPWPTDSGSRIRLATAIRAMAQAGSVDLFAIVPEGRTDFEDPNDELATLRTGRVTVRPAGLVFATVHHPLLPAGIPTHDRQKVSRALARFMTGTYDLVWFFDVRAWVLARVPFNAPQIIDLIDLEDEKIEARLAVPPAETSGRRRWETWPGRVWSRMEARRWTRLYRVASKSVAGTVACSDLDARRARSRGASRMNVVVNTYPRPRRPVGRETVGSPPVLLFQGTMRYPPNAHAASWLVREIVPLIRGALPDLQVRLVGVANPMVEALHDAPGVTVLGRVGAIESELRRADVVVVPVRFGSGTRLKILEAFAHGIPVVSTTLGAEGLGVEDGRHLLIADSAQAMADACVRLLTDFPLRRRLVAAAHDRYLEAFREEVAFGQIDALFNSLETAR